MRVIVLTVLLVLMTAGCGGSPSQGDGGGSEVTTFGIELLNERLIDSNPGCITCHSLDEGVTLVGPSLFGVGTRATTQVPGQSARDYLREAIVDPDAYVVEDFSAGLMVSSWVDSLSEAQIDSLVELLLTF